MATQLFDACSNGNVEEAKQLLQNPEINPNWQDNLGYTPFYVACRNGHIEIVKLLLNDKSIDVNKASHNNATPFYIACFKENINVVKLLLASGREVDLNIKNRDGKTAIDIAKEYKKNNVVELIETFQKNQSETREKLRKEFGLSEEPIVKNNQDTKKSTYEIEYNNNLFKLKTSSTTLSEFGNDIRSKIKIQENIEMVLHYKENEKLYILDDMEDLEEGMTIKVSVPTQSQPPKVEKKIEDISNLNISDLSVFLTHTWAKDELNRDNHARVGTVNKLLKAQGFKTWFDEDKMAGYIDNMMAEGINNSDVILVFITKAYMEKVASKGHDNCKGEFTFATTRNKKMVPIVMEPCMKNPGQWDGPLGIRLAGDLYVDMSGTDSENDLTGLIEHMKKI